MEDPRLHDEVPEAPVDWTDIPLGVGQEPNAAFGSFQHRDDRVSGILGDDVRRDPCNLPPRVVVRYPERPW